MCCDGSQDDSLILTLVIGSLPRDSGVKVEGNTMCRKVDLNMEARCECIVTS